MKILFICKKRINEYGNSTGLLNSATFVSNALKLKGIESKVVTVIDNNCIDREVTLYEPTHVIIEAWWVVPDKFDILCMLHPNVKWVVRSHSKIPFFANEGIAMEWMWGYIEKAKKYNNFFIAYNDKKTAKNLSKVFHHEILYLPNVYCPNIFTFPQKQTFYKDWVDIGCFGSIRPMKNHLIQACAAIKFADECGYTLKFHINAGRTEQKGDTVLKNLRNLFKHTKHELVEHGWMNYKDFMRVVRWMDMGMQASMTESFNIVTADFVNTGIPIVVSKDIEWMPFLAKANNNRIDKISDALHRVKMIKILGLQWIDKLSLWKYNYNAIKVWLKLDKITNI